MLCDTNGSSLPRADRARRRRRRRRARRPRARSASTRHNDAGCGVANALAAVEAGALQVQGTMNGVGERTGNANLDRRSSPTSQLKMGHEVLAYEQLGAADRDRALRRRAAQPQPATRASPTSASTPSPTRAACTSPACARTRRPSSTSTRRWSATERDLLISELAAAATVAEKAAAAGIALDDAGGGAR